MRRPRTRADSNVRRPATAPIMSFDPPVRCFSGTMRCKTRPSDPPTNTATPMADANFSGFIHVPPPRQPARPSDYRHSADLSISLSTTSPAKGCRGLRPPRLLPGSATTFRTRLQAFRVWPQARSSRAQQRSQAPVRSWKKAMTRCSAALVGNVVVELRVKRSGQRCLSV